MTVLPRRLRHGEEATLTEHLGELRTRIVIALLAIAVGFGVSFAFHERLLDWLNRPLADGVRPTTFGVAEPFFTSIVISLWVGFALALPIVLWQVWAFLAPAFREHTQRVVVVFVLFSALLLAAGVVFAYFVALPKAVHFLTNFDKDLYNIQIRARDYYSFVMLVLAAVGAAFQLPIFVMALVRLGVLSTRKLRRNRRIGVVAVVALAVALPGVDPVTLAFTAAPLLALFELSIWLSVLFERRWQTRAAAREAVVQAGEW
jgi:sec-independent protein translocase protein TatC